MSLAPMTSGTPAPSSSTPVLRAVDLTQPQKAAAVLLALGANTAETLLRQLPEDELELIAEEIVNLGALAPDELMVVLKEFHAEAQAHRYVVSGGEAHARELLRALSGEGADAIIDRVVATTLQTPFSFLTLFTPDAIARQLNDEHPQTVAVVLSHVSTRLAAQVLAELPEVMRADVAIRVARQEASPREVVARIEENLRMRLGDASGRARRPSQGAGLRELANMLNNADETTSKSILESIEQTDERLAKEVRAQMFVFADLVTLAARDLQELLRQIETSQLALAMKGLDEGQELYETIMGNLSERAREALNEERDLLGPVKATEVTAARAEIAAHVRQLVEDGTVTVVRGDGSDVIA